MPVEDGVPPSEAVRLDSDGSASARVDEFPAVAVHGIPETNARFIFAGAVLVIFIGVFAGDIWASSRYWTDAHSVEDSFAPFVTLLASAVGSAVTFYFTDRRNR